MGGTQGLASLGVRGGGDGAGVHDDDVGVASPIHQTIAGAGELLRQDGAVRLVQLAPVGLNGDSTGLGNGHTCNTGASLCCPGHHVQSSVDSHVSPAEVCHVVIGVDGGQGIVTTRYSSHQAVDTLVQVIHGEDQIVDSGPPFAHPFGGIRQG